MATWRALSTMVSTAVLMPGMRLQVCMCKLGLVVMMMMRVDAGKVDGMAINGIFQRALLHPCSRPLILASRLVSVVVDVQLALVVLIMMLALLVVVLNPCLFALPVNRCRWDAQHMHLVHHDDEALHEYTEPPPVFPSLLTCCSTLSHSPNSNACPAFALLNRPAPTSPFAICNPAALPRADSDCVYSVPQFHAATGRLGEKPIDREQVESRGN
jgi:hypothetical protein